MKCLMCKESKPIYGLITVTLERGETNLVIKNVPALVCPLCSEAYVDELTTERLFAEASEMEESGLQMDVRYYSNLAI